MAPLDFTQLDQTAAAYQTALKALLTQLEGGPVPPPGVLRDKPPGYPSYTGYTTIAVTTRGQNLGLVDTKDYILDLSTISWSSGAAQTIGLHINGGRNVVVIGGALLFTGTNATDDALAILIDAGDANGTVYLEGLDLKCCNDITVRSKRAVIVQNCRAEVSAYQDNYTNIHPDLLQVWGTSSAHTPCKSIRMDRYTGSTTFTGLTSLVQQAPAGSQVDPVVWDCVNTNIKPKTNLNGTKDAGNYVYLSSEPTGQAQGPYTQHVGDIYCELPTGGGGAYTRGIDDIVILRKLGGGAAYFPYEIKNPSNTLLYTSPAAPAGGSGLAAAKAAGNFLTFDRVPKFVGRRFIIGPPPNGDFCPVGVPGPNYVSPGYV